MAHDVRKQEEFTSVGRGKESDIFRDPPVRYLGYANEVGEAFRSVIPRSAVWFSYAVASGYCMADAFYRGSKLFKVDTSPQRTKNVLLSTTDTLLWQAFASVIVPGFTINQVCSGVLFAQSKISNVKLKNRWIPTIVGLSIIPLIISPIDCGVENVMNLTFRKWTGFHPNGDFKDG